MTPVELHEPVSEPVDQGPVLEAVDLRVWYGTERGSGPGGRRRLLRPPAVARSSAWSASPGAASRRSAADCWACCPTAPTRDGEVLFQGRDMLTLKAKERDAMRGIDLGMIFQEPLTRLNPLMRISEHFEETIKPARAGSPRMRSSAARSRCCG